jgi:hypothetical protein
MEQLMSTHEPFLASESERPVWGVAAIAEICGLRPKQTYHMLERGYLPAKKVGGRWAAMPSRLRATFNVEKD